METVSDIILEIAKDPDKAKKNALELRNKLKEFTWAKTAEQFKKAIHRCSCELLNHSLISSPTLEERNFDESYSKKDRKELKPLDTYRKIISDHNKNFNT